MTSRILTGAGLLALLLTALYFGGLVFSLLWIACVCIALYELYHSLSHAGHRPAAWPTWAALFIAIPGFTLLPEIGGLLLLVILVAVTLFFTSVLVMFRDQPKLEDLLMSVLPLFAVAMPGMSLLGMTRISPLASQRIFLALAFFVPVMGDSLAFFIGSTFGKVKLNPQVSPNKTVEGAVAGLFGSLITACVIYLIGSACGAPMPAFYHFLIIGLLGGIAGQIGDLFASLVKRHCNIKDFGNIFPGHGGMLDRLDSILFAGSLVYLYQALPFM